MAFCLFHLVYDNSFLSLYYFKDSSCASLRQVFKNKIQSSSLSSPMADQVNIGKQFCHILLNTY